MADSGELSEQDVRQAIDRVIKPLVEADRGKVEFLRIDGHRVVVRLAGAYSGCPGTPLAVQNVFQPALRKALGDHVELQHTL